MIKAAGRNADGSTLVILGLTPENLRRLEAGRPILVNQEDLDLPPGKIIIVFGDTTDAITQQFRAAGIPINDMGQPKPGQTFRQRP